MIKLNKIEQGRSMVEMLGVLAIIGVLSVAGIAGYTTAMNKHRANEILNEASKRAIVVAAQIASGRTPTLTEFTDNEVGGATFSQEVKDKNGGDWTTEDSQFRIGYVSGKEPSEAVLAQMKNIAGTNGMIQDFEGGLTYNNDLTPGVIEEVEDELETCAFSSCMVCEEDEKGNKTHEFLPSGTPCESAGQSGTCDGKGQCKPTGLSCSSVNGCPEGYFCNYGGTKTPNICEKANPKTATINGTTFYFNSSSDLRSWCRPADGGKNCIWGYLSYYGAQSWCYAIGKKMISADDFLANEEILKNTIPILSIQTSYWLDDDRWWEKNLTPGTSGSVGRKDGYNNTGGVICK